MKKIIVTCGDPNGIGAEILLKALKKSNLNEEIIFIGNKEILDFYGEKLNLPVPKIETIEPDANFQIKPGKIIKENGLYSGKCIEKAAKMLMEGKGKALITLPICKENFQESGYHFQGHTDFLQHLTKTDKTAMFFYSPSFSVALHTVHIPLKKVFNKIKSNEIENGIEFVVKETKKTINFKNPEIYVCGLNPHAGENGKIGKEDFEIKRAVQNLIKKNLPVKGVFPSDTLFAKIENNPEKIVYAMYHDQGLIGIKTKHPKKSVNITLGLPFLRLSVSHGTAFDIAGKGIADYNNLLYVLEIAKKLLGGE